MGGQLKQDLWTILKVLIYPNQTDVSESFMDPKMGPKIDPARLIFGDPYQ